MNEKLVDTLESNGIKTLVLDMKSYEDVKREVGILAQVTGLAKRGGADCRYGCQDSGGS